MSGKRGADKQIDKDSYKEGGDEDGESEGAMARAAPAALAERKIRGMPARKGTPVSTPTPPATASAFSGFSAMSATPLASNPFASLSSTSTTSGFGNGFSTVAPPSTPSFSFSTPSTVPIPSPSAFPSFSSSFKAAPAPASIITPANPPALTYYMGLRALNLSFLDSLSKTNNEDPFVDFGKTLGALKAKYEQHRASIENSYKSEDLRNESVVDTSNNVAQIKVKEIVVSDTEMSIPSSTPTPPVPAFKSFTPPAPAPSVSSPIPALTLPVPPATLSWGGKVVTSTSPSAAPASTTPPPGSFIPTFPSSKKADVRSGEVVASIASDTPTFTTTKVSPSAAKLINAPAAPSPLRFGQKVSPPSTPSSEAPDSSIIDSIDVVKKPFSFGASFGKMAKEGSISSTPSPPSFASNPTPTFSPSTPPTISSITTTTTTPVLTTPSAPSFSFGASTPASSPAPAKVSTSPLIPKFGAGAALAPTFAFGAATSGFGFGNTAGSVAFGFGGAPSTAGSGTGFNFGGANPFATPSAPTVFKTSAESAKIEEIVEEGKDVIKEAESSSSTPKGGAGEENEKTLHTARLKLYKLIDGVWKDFGIGSLMIKESEGEGGNVRRILCRNEGNGAVMMNFRLTSSIELTAAGNIASFLGFEGSSPMMYRAKLKTVDEMKALKEAWESFSS